MIKNYEKLTIFKNWELFLGLIISLSSHILFFKVLDFKNSNLLGEKYIPIELIDTDTYFKIGDSLEVSKSENVEDNSEFKEDTLVNEVIKKNIENIEKIVTEKQIINNENLTNKVNLENQYKGIWQGKKDQDIEKGSILGKGSEKITCLNCVKPKYPKLALQRGYEGILKLKVTINKNGTVSDAFITQSTGYKVLDNAGIKAALESKFYPLRKQSKFNIVYDLKLN